MNNSPMNLDSIRQPKPSVGVSDVTKKERVYNAPNVGIVNPPTITKTPLEDTLVIKKQENPKMRYLLTPKSNKGFKFHNIFSLGIIGCSIGALLSLLKKKK